MAKVPTRIISSSIAVDVTPNEYVAAQLFGGEETTDVKFVVDGVYWFYEGWVFYYHRFEGRIAVLHDISNNSYPFDREEDDGSS